MQSAPHAEHPDNENEKSDDTFQNNNLNSSLGSFNPGNVDYHLRSWLLRHLPFTKVGPASPTTDWFMGWADKLISLRNSLILILELAGCDSDKPSALPLPSDFY